ncbi:hypothetical protein SALBM311S_04567 [Streptomyces alboniger]
MRAWARTVGGTRAAGGSNSVYSAVGVTEARTARRAQDGLAAGDDTRGSACCDEDPLDRLSGADVHPQSRQQRFEGAHEVSAPPATTGSPKP